MATLPANLALANIADAASIIASDHRNNYSSIQAQWNALMTLLAAGAAGQVLTSGGGTTVSWAAGAMTGLTGRINSNGTIAAGTGFSCIRNAAGSYTVTFTVGFAAVPTVMLSSTLTGGIGYTPVLLSTPSTGAFSVGTFKPSDSTQTQVDSAFQFLAVTTV